VSVLSWVKVAVCLWLLRKAVKVVKWLLIVAVAVAAWPVTVVAGAGYDLSPFCHRNGRAPAARAGPTRPRWRGRGRFRRHKVKDVPAWALRADPG
jgi:hypothetical protein